VEQLSRRTHQMVRNSPFLDQATRSGWGAVQKLLQPRKLRTYLASTDRMRVMIGAGPSKQHGWLPTDLTPSRPDVMFLDARKKLPFQDACVDLIHTEHMIEHIDFDDGQRFLAECARILKPGGRIRISTPDFDRVLALAQHPDPRVGSLIRAANARNQVDPEKLDDPIFAVNRLFSGHGHRFLYSVRMLKECLLSAGLQDVRRQEVGESEEPDLRGLEQHDQRVGAEWNSYHSLIVEAVKPQT